ncbi:autotransporter outer membrane beta-barrel domain-containing protein [Sphingomonas sp. IW22]|uniref:autotransporter outer membrane beta-barrel domain-containing protein n=1 Tax=Sphingomonas sp. IW22 TaxID=3242489 RepID=UPI00351FB49A
MSLGVAGTIGKSDQQVDALASNDSAESWGLSGIVGYATGGLQAQAGVGYAWHDVDTSRTTRVGALGDRLNGRYDATTRQLFANLSYDIGAGAIDLAPFASIANVRVTTGSFAETGGATALSVARGSQDSSFLTLGADARVPLAATVSATLRGGWQHGWGDLAATSIARLPGSAAFRVDGIRLPQDAAILDAGVEAEVGPMRIGASYTGSYASGWTQHGARLTATVRF